MKEEGVEYDAIEVHRAGAIVSIRLNRPKVANAINSIMEIEIVELLKACDADDSVNCVMIVANGAVFSAGHDIAQVAEEIVTGIEPATLVD